MPEWRNWQTHTTQNRAGNHVGSSPTLGTRCVTLTSLSENGIEFWYARELMNCLNYSKWSNFKKVISKAMESCKNSDISVFYHFAYVGKMVKIGSEAQREQQDYKLTRYACYLIAQNGDSRKKVISLAQTYFAVQTRKQEISEKEYSELTEDEKRFYQRNLTRKGNYSLNQTAMNYGISINNMWEK